MFHKIYSSDSVDLSIMAAQLARSEVIVLPTETVYGLAADATSSHAVGKIYEIKNRPSFNPLIVHARDLRAAREIADFSPQALALAKSFWPGPLTLVLPLLDGHNLSPLVTAGLQTVAIRCPNHPVFQTLLSRCLFPLAAPSANPSQQLSATTAQDAAEGFKDLNIELTIIDGGACQTGLESTIVDLSTSQPIILRPGPLSAETLMEACQFEISNPPSAQGSIPLKAPGMMARHYAPLTPIRLNVRHVEKHEVLLAFGLEIPSSEVYTLNLSVTENLTEAAHNFFSFLHQLDHSGPSCIAVMSIPEHGLGRAINDRLKRAAVRI